MVKKASVIVRDVLLILILFIAYSNLPSGEMCSNIAEHRENAVELDKKRTAICHAGGISLFD